MWDNHKYQDNPCSLLDKNIHHLSKDNQLCCHICHQCEHKCGFSCISTDLYSFFLLCSGVLCPRQVHLGNPISHHIHNSRVCSKNDHTWTSCCIQSARSPWDGCHTYKAWPANFRPLDMYRFDKYWRKTYCHLGMTKVSLYQIEAEAKQIYCASQMCQWTADNCHHWLWSRRQSTLSLSHLNKHICKHKNRLLRNCTCICIHQLEGVHGSQSPHHTDIQEKNVSQSILMCPLLSEMSLTLLMLCTNLQCSCTTCEFQKHKCCKIFGILLHYGNHQWKLVARLLQLHQADIWIVGCHGYCSFPL